MCSVNCIVGIYYSIARGRQVGIDLDADLTVSVLNVVAGFENLFH